MLKASKYLFFAVILFVSCKKDPPSIDQEEAKGNVSLNFTNVAGSQVLALNTATYVNQNQDTFSVSLFRYYVSNIKFFRDDGFIYSEPESYHLLDAADSNSCKFTIENIPVGNYIGMELVIGVDSLRNCAGAQSGALDPARDMFWDWSQGYIFAKLEGQCNTIPLGNFFMHVGGFTGPYNSIVKAYPAFGNKVLTVEESHGSKMYLKTDLMEWFRNPQTISLGAYANVASGKKSKEISSNYSDMFSISAITH
jgi:hypothetical protein